MVSEQDDRSPGHRLAQHPRPGPRPFGDRGHDVAHDAARDHGVRLGDDRAVSQKVRLRRVPAGGREVG